MNTSGGAEDVFEDPLLEPEGGGAAGPGGPVPEPQGETASASPWWKQWCARIGAGEEGLDPTRTTLALQLQAQDHAEKLAREARAAQLAASAAQQAASCGCGL